MIPVEKEQEVAEKGESPEEGLQQDLESAGGKPQLRKLEKGKLQAEGAGKQKDSPSEKSGCAQLQLG